MDIDIKINYLVKSVNQMCCKDMALFSFDSSMMKKTIKEENIYLLIASSISR